MNLSVESFCFKVGLILLTLLSSQLRASDYPRVDQDIGTYDDKVAEMDAEFAHIPPDPKNKHWVKAKLSHMVAVDQYMRGYSDTPFHHSYTEQEKTEFWKQFYPRWKRVDAKDTADLKELLKLYQWFTISEFGAQADNDAWLLVQHADQDWAFQKQCLAILDKLYLKKETNPRNYAYLWDRIAASWDDPSRRKPQRYGTQGQCVGPGKWEPLQVEDPDHLDDRRKEVGLEPEADYIKRFKDICH